MKEIRNEEKRKEKKLANPPYEPQQIQQQKNYWQATPLDQDNILT